MLEHFVHAFIQILDVLVRIVGERIARRSSQINCLVLVSKRSTTTVPTLYVSVV